MFSLWAPLNPPDFGRFSISPGILDRELLGALADDLGSPIMVPARVPIVGGWRIVQDRTLRVLHSNSSALDSSGSRCSARQLLNKHLEKIDNVNCGSSELLTSNLP